MKTVPLAILITQSLQNDFIKPIERYDPIPSMLHIGYAETKRLMGEDPKNGPIARVMKWAYALPIEKMKIIHIRDWHYNQDSLQEEHLRQPGDHGIYETDGTELAFHVPEEYANRPVTIVDSVSLSDFIGTKLTDHLTEFIDQPIRVGLMGVWTDAKIFFLAYELKARFPKIQLAVCSALTASSSKSNHYIALEQMKRLFGVHVFSSIGEFTNFLAGSEVEIDLPKLDSEGYPKVEFEEMDVEFSQTDSMIIRYLFRDSRIVKLKTLTGGYSGNLVLLSESEDIHGHSEVPHVIKIGKQDEIGNERASFEKIESVMGNNAPRIVDFVDFKGRGALKYRYAAMSGKTSNTFQKLYMNGISKEKGETMLRTVLIDQLGRFYAAANREYCNLLDYYNIDPGYAERMKQKVEMVLGSNADKPVLRLPTGHEFPNVYTFYSTKLEKLKPKAQGSAYFSYIHGDLNGANIIIDGHENVWLIDFFFTHYGHALKDLIKLENDLMYIWTPVESEEDLAEAVKITDALMKVRDLGRPIPPVETTNITKPEFIRAYNTIRFLRSLYPSIIHQDRNVQQLLIGQLWYSGRTLTYEESNKWQKLWALYTVGHVSKQLTDRIKATGPLRIDWLDPNITTPGKIGLTILPGRKDRGRSLKEDISVMKKEKITHVLTLITSNEFQDYGVEDLLDAYVKAGFKTKHFPILDHSVSSVPEMDDTVDWITDVLEKGGNLMIHCLGGLGRSGIVSASYLVSTGMSPQGAIGAVRRARSSKAIENTYQEQFVRRYAAYKSSENMTDENKIFERFEDVIDFAMGEEKSAVQFYTELASIVNNPSIKELFEGFAREENGHYQQLLELKKAGSIDSGELNIEVLKSMVTLDEETVPLVNIGPDMDYQDALELAMFKEKSAFKLYLKMAEIIQNEDARSLLISLAEDEAKHKLHFELQYEKIKV